MMRSGFRLFQLVPALQPILHEAEVRHASPLPSRLRGVAARALLPPTSTGMLPARFDTRAGSSERVQTAAAQRLSRRGVLVTPGANGVRSPLVGAAVQQRGPVSAAYYRGFAVARMIVACVI